MRENPREMASARRLRRRAAPRAPSPSAATTHCGRRGRFSSPPFARRSGVAERPNPPAASTRVVPTSGPHEGDRQQPKPPTVLPTSSGGTGTQTQPNSALQLTNTGAAQSVACAPLCLLPVLAAERNVGWASSVDLKLFTFGAPTLQDSEPCLS